MHKKMSYSNFEEWGFGIGKEFPIHCISRSKKKKRKKEKESQGGGLKGRAFTQISRIQSLSKLKRVTLSR